MMEKLIGRQVFNGAHLSLDHMPVGFTCFKQLPVLPGQQSAIFYHTYNVCAGNCAQAMRNHKSCAI